jgi:hypothetical protein
MNTMLFGVHLTCAIGWLYWFCSDVGLKRKLTFIFLLWSILDSFWNCMNYTLIMMFSEKLVYNKVVDNSLI